MKPYQSMLDRMPVSDGACLGLLYSEVLDFEADGDPELGPKESQPAQPEPEGPEPVETQ